MAITDGELKKMPQSTDVSVAQAGKNTLLYLNKGTTASPVWVLVGGQRNTPLTRKANTLDASDKSTKGWKTTIAGLKEWSMAYSGLVIMDDDGLKMLDYAFTNDMQVHAKIEYGNGEYRTGFATITDYEEDAAHDAMCTVKVTLSGVGPISALQPKHTTTTP